MAVLSWLGMVHLIGNEIDLPFSQHQASHSWGFLFVRGWVDLDMRRELLESYNNE